MYSFDYHLDLPALKTLIAIEGIKEELPAFVIQDKRSYGFTTLEDLQILFPEELFETATSTEE